MTSITEIKVITLCPYVPIKNKLTLKVIYKI
nr:MAG TPA: hypothetical protein [Caudoviricetes sp.]